MQKLCCVRTRQQFSASLDYFITSSPPYLHQFSTIFGENCISKYIEDVILTETNKVLDKEPVTYGELMRWMGLWVLISTVDGSDRRSFWLSKSVNMYEGAPF